MPRAPCVLNISTCRAGRHPATQEQAKFVAYTHRSRLMGRPNSKALQYRELGVVYWNIVCEMYPQAWPFKGKQY